MRLFFCRLFYFFRRRSYTHILSLGSNCEVAFQFFKNYNFVESTLFAWTVCSCDQLIHTLQNLDLIGSQKIVLLEHKMFLDCATGIQFHPKDNHVTPENEDAYRTELLGRLTYLKKKFVEVGKDGKSKLYVYKYMEPELSAVIESRVRKIYDALRQLNEDPFDFLLVLREEAPQVQFSEKKIFIRRVKQFAPGESVTDGPFDRWGWCRLFSEFYPAVILKRTKHFKFEEV